MKKTVILTGATGFVGANIARRLLTDGHDVHILVRANHKNWRIKEIKKELAIHITDFEDKDKLTKLTKIIKPDWIFHTAVYGAYSSQQDVDQTVQTNVVSLSNLVQAAMASGFETFVNTGSSSEYGYKDHAPTEDEYIDPNSYYAVTKAAATYFCRFSANQQKVHIPTLRLYSVYGAYEEPARLMPTLLRAAIDGTYPPLVDPSIARDYVYIDDVVDAYIKAAKVHTKDFGPIYNVGTQKQTSLKEVVEIVQNQFSIPSKPKWGSMKNRSWDTSTWVSTTKKIQKEIGWKPKFDLESGIKAMTQWIREYDAKNHH